MDGNVESGRPTRRAFLDGDGGPAHFVDNGNGRNIPDKIRFPGYNEKWKRAVAKDRRRNPAVGEMTRQSPFRQIPSRRAGPRGEAVTDDGTF